MSAAASFVTGRVRRQFKLGSVLSACCYTLSGAFQTIEGLLSLMEFARELYSSGDLEVFAGVFGAGLLVEGGGLLGAGFTRVLFRCGRRGGVSAGQRGTAELRGPGRNATSAEWRAEAGSPGGGWGSLAS